MLRNLAVHCCRAYTCSCLVRPVVHPPTTGLVPQNSLGFRYFGSSVTRCGGGKLTGEKAISRMLKAAQEAKVEAIDSENVDVEGLTDAGVIIPTLETHAMLIDGVRYDELPIIHVLAGLNNTIIKATDFKGGTSFSTKSCGREGFKGAKRKTTVAAQATAYSLGTRRCHQSLKTLDQPDTPKLVAPGSQRYTPVVCSQPAHTLQNVRRKHGLKNVRVVLKGIGVGRQASLKGLQMAGLNIVSLTDDTPIVMSGRRPRKPKRH